MMALALKIKMGNKLNTNRQNIISTNGQPSAQLFPKRWSLSNQNRTKSIMNKHKVKHHRNSDTKTGNRELRQNNRLGTVCNDGGGCVLRATAPYVTDVVQAFSWLFGSHDNPLTHQ